MPSFNVLFDRRDVALGKEAPLSSFFRRREVLIPSVTGGYQDPWQAGEGKF